MAESEGFEPSNQLPSYTLSRGAPSATRPALQKNKLLTRFYHHLMTAHPGCALLGLPVLALKGPQFMRF